MGVKACFRSGCEEIMCEYYSNKYGYICNECLLELKQAGRQDIEAFMRSPRESSEAKAWEYQLDLEFNIKETS